VSQLSPDFEHQDPKFTHYKPEQYNAIGMTTQFHLQCNGALDPTALKAFHGGGIARSEMERAIPSGAPQRSERSLPSGALSVCPSPTSVFSAILGKGSVTGNGNFESFNANRKRDRIVAKLGCQRDPELNLVAESFWEVMGHQGPNGLSVKPLGSIRPRVNFEGNFVSGFVFVFATVTKVCSASF
jgi:hypothetical protein